MLNILTRKKQKDADGPRMMAFPTYDYGSQHNYQKFSRDGFQKNVIAHRCITLISRSAASVPWLLYNKSADVEEVLEHPLLNILKHPNPRQGGASFIEEVLGYLLIAGHTYIEAVCDDKGELCELYSLRPDRVTVIPGNYGLPAFYEYKTDKNRRRIPVDPVSGHSRILEIKLFHPSSDWVGLSPIEVAQQAIDQHNVVGGHNLSLLNNGGRPSGILSIKTDGLTDGQRQVLRDDMKRVHEGIHNAGRMMILEGDFEWKELGLSPKDMDFINAKYVAAREIAQVFGVPPTLVGVPGDATFANYKEARLHVWEDTILPLLDRLAHEFNTWLPHFYDVKNIRLEHDLDAIPALAPKREALWARVRDADFLTLNEKRQILGYAPVEGGNNIAGII